MIISMLLLVMTVVHGIIANDMMTVLGCDNTSVTLSCPVGSYISLIRANYGRFSISVCNHYARDDIHTHCHSMEESTDILAKMCNKLSSCHVVVNSDVLPEVCPETPKYLEAQYQCRSYRHMEEEVRQTKLPELGGNISDVWSDRDMVLDREAVDEAIETVIKNNHIPITHKPEVSVLKALVKPSDSVIEVKGVNSLRKAPKEDFSEQKDEERSSRMLRSSLHDSRVYMTDKEVMIIILTSSICVTLLIISVFVIIVKTCPVCHTTNTVENSGISDSSLYTIANNNNNFMLQRFQQTRPDTESPNKLMREGISQCDRNKNEIAEHQYKYEEASVIPSQLLLSAIPCHLNKSDFKGNIHIKYDISYSHAVVSCPCRERTGYYTHDNVMSSYYDDNFVCDV